MLIRFTPAKRSALFISLLTATIWACHPLLVSTVLYAVQRMTQLSALFIILGLNSYLYGRLRLLCHQSYNWFFMASAWLIFFPLAVLSKETGILLPWFVFCLEYFILNFRAPKVFAAKIKGFNVAASIGLLLGALLYYRLHLNKFLALFADKGSTLYERLLTQTKVLVFYLKLILFPNIAQMGLYHDDFQVANTFTPEVGLCLLLLAILIWLIFALKRKQPIIAFGLAWFFISQTIESTVIPLEMVFEHRVYLGMIGILLIPCYYYVYYFNQLKSLTRYITGGVLFLILLIQMDSTRVLSKAWSSNERFLSMSVFYHPYSARTHIELANLYLHKEDYENAFIELAIAQQLEPQNAGISLHRLLIMCRSTAVPAHMYLHAEQTIKKGSITPYVVLVLDQMIKNMFQNQCRAVDKAKIRKLIQVALRNPYLKYKPQYQAMLYQLEGGVEILLDNVPQSLILLDKAFQANPKQIEPLLEKAYLELRFGMLNEANQTINQIKKTPHYWRHPQDKIQQLTDYYLHIEKQGNSL